LIERVAELIVSIVVLILTTIALVYGKIDEKTWLMVTGAILFYWFGVNIGSRIREARVRAKK